MSDRNGSRGGSGHRGGHSHLPPQYRSYDDYDDSYGAPRSRNRGYGGDRGPRGPPPNNLFGPGANAPPGRYPYILPQSQAIQQQPQHFQQPQYPSVPLQSSQPLGPPPAQPQGFGNGAPGLGIPPMPYGGQQGPPRRYRAPYITMMQHLRPHGQGQGQGYGQQGYGGEGQGHGPHGYHHHGPRGHHGPRKSFDRHHHNSHGGSGAQGSGGQQQQQGHGHGSGQQGAGQGQGQRRQRQPSVGSEDDLAAAVPAPRPRLTLPPPTPVDAAVAALAAAARAADTADNDAFVTPAFPRPPRTLTESTSTWALMVEAGCQALEAVAGPFLEGAMMELFGSSWERELFAADLPLPPFAAATCAALVGRCQQLQDKLPITIRKRAEGVVRAAEALRSDPGALGPEDVTAAHTAAKGMMQDLVKALRLPSLMGAAGGPPPSPSPSPSPAPAGTSPTGPPDAAADPITAAAAAAAAAVAAAAAAAAASAAAVSGAPSPRGGSPTSPGAAAADAAASGAASPPTPAPAAAPSGPITSRSKQWCAFAAELLPHCESAVLYLDVLLKDCAEAVAAREAVRAAAACGAAAGAASGEGDVPAAPALPAEVAAA